MDDAEQQQQDDEADGDAEQPEDERDHPGPPFEDANNNARRVPTARHRPTEGAMPRWAGYLLVRAMAVRETTLLAGSSTSVDPVSVT